MIKLLQIGLGPLGLKTYQYISEKSTMQTVAAVDIDPSLKGKDLGELCGGSPTGIKIVNDLEAVSNMSDIDAVVLTTSSNMKAIGQQILEILDYNLPVVSTCEEMSYPWIHDVSITAKIEKKAVEKNVAVVATGVNPGFLMDTLPSVLTSVCREVEHIHVSRIQDAQSRRIPFQRKIGAGLTPSQFEDKKATGTLRHVGLTESMHFIASSVGWKLDYTEDVISPVITEIDINTPAMKIAAGNAIGVRQVGIGKYEGEEKVKLVFEAAVGSGTSYDEIKIKGSPDIHSKIEGGVHGDIATCSIVLNTIPSLLKASPGLKTMRDLSLVSFTP